MWKHIHSNKTKEDLALLLIWQCFPHNLNYQISLISSTSLLLKGEKTDYFEIFQGTYGKSKNYV